jgi:hypothetical protein
VALHLFLIIVLIGCHCDFPGVDRGMNSAVRQVFKGIFIALIPTEDIEHDETNTLENVQNKINHICSELRIARIPARPYPQSFAA